jgi:methylthioribose-1-phosphate isomerase
MAVAMRNMTIRGAPALGVAGAFGMVLDAVNSRLQSISEMKMMLHKSARILLESRPTAVNLAWGVKRMTDIVDKVNTGSDELRQQMLAEALEMAEEDVRTNFLLAQYGASLIDDGDTIIHHCNTGSLAVVDWGTALGAIRYAHEHGKKINVMVDETRPRLQGSRLTAWECKQYGIPYEIITDNAAGYYLQSGKVQKVFFGADRVAANGDVVNKIGTYMLSLAAHANGVPVISVFPLSTLDLSIAGGKMVNIEQRDPGEVLGIQYQGETASPTGARALNPAFDVTPNALISAWVTERGIIRPPFAQNISSYVYNNGLNGE